MTSRWNDPSFTASMENQVWTASPTIRRYLHRLVSGNPDCDWLTWVESKHLPPAVDRALVLGCGSGWLERALAQRGRFRSIIACDFAPATVEKARALAAEQGMDSIEYRVLDLEHEELDGPYGAVIANDVLHHITDLEGVAERIHGALTSDGKIIFNEYVGPNRFQYVPERIDLINRYFRLLPDELRRDPHGGHIVWKRERQAAAQVIREDPTEAVRSEDVLPVFRSAFQVEKEYPYGGGLLNLLLYEVVVNFREEVPAHVRLLEILCAAEERLSASGALEPDFAVFVGRRRAEA
ncbi:MAG: class I SAM-dependent methyltransferase [Acidobacteriota bacterium]